MNGKSNGFVKALCNHVSVNVSRRIKAAHSLNKTGFFGIICHSLNSGVLLF